MSAVKRYLGDAVYADCDELGRIVLTTENGISATNTIVLEPEVYAALLAWVEKLRAEAKP
jgi:hypothetical protein